MYNRTNQVLEQYPFLLHQTSNGRGAIICDTDLGQKVLKEYKGSEGRADFLYSVLQFLRENGSIKVDCIVKTREEHSVFTDVDGTVYMVRDRIEGRECDVKSRDDILKSVRALASVHNLLRQYKEDIPDYLKASPDALLLEYQKHSRELKKVRNYIGAKKKKNDFEMEFAKQCDFFIKQANQIIEIQEQELKKEIRNVAWYGICHGDFNHHNIVFMREGIAVINYERALYDVQVGDLSNFMRKIMEKYNWNLGLGMDMIDAYQKERSPEEGEMKQLYIRLAYPEKFWKISNHYYNTGKAWVCSRDLDKLNKVVEQNEEKDRFLQLISHNLLF